MNIYAYVTTHETYMHIGVGKAFGFSVPPRVDLNFSARGNIFIYIYGLIVFMISYM
jgi:hypothetical protein